MAEKRLYDTEQYDPNFYFPEEFIEMEALELPAEDEEDVEVNDDIPDDDTSNEVPVPDKITIVSQTIRMKKNGDYVIDVVIEVEDDVDDAVKYDVRITPVK